MADYIKALTTELTHYLPRRQANQTTQPTTVYFGGGTPSLLTPAQLSKIINNLDLSKTTEFNLEAHPATLTTQKVAAYQQLGVNRLSIGIQSWNPQILAHMGRQYDAKMVRSLIAEAQDRGLTNINFDHIISYPNQTDEILVHDLNTSLNLQPSHISIYPLECHPHTQIRRSPNQTKIIRQFTLAQNLLVKSGFSHYEELNFCLPHRECRHNLNFWQGQDYIGVGCSAVSKIGHIIRTNTANLKDYLADPLNSHSTITMPSKSDRLLRLDLLHRLQGQSL